MGIVQAIDQAYCGRAKIERLLYIAKQCRGMDVGMRSLERVHDELKEHVSVCVHYGRFLNLAPCIELDGVHSDHFVWLALCRQGIQRCTKK